MIPLDGPPLFLKNKAGTCSIGLISRNSLECCSPPLFTRLTGFISYGISFRFNAINKH
ncbi:hypothetical protein ALC62_15861 [Cyphomyrmex costatus]|uniref:Uncharacterized protein n=1 Tax=Cyphomyrmex costatus TaxID=456900 RepID=A0A195C019_9HYME|nr:hypothetical protein ALC62_15861 [Cyphomyrmex costatus]